jgi:hypothetical protein
MTNGPYRFAGLSGVTLDSPTFDLGEGVQMRAVYAHVFGANMMAFSRAQPGKPHPAPWKAARGGFGFDIKIELRVPNSIGALGANDLIWLIAALFRLLRVPYLSVPVVCNIAFDAIPLEPAEPTIEPFELSPRILAPGESCQRRIGTDDLEWVREHWVTCRQLCFNHPRFATAFRAFDSATVAGKASSSSLLALWGGLEQLFSPSPSELRFRVASLVSAYLEPLGPGRLALYKEILSLYSHRSQAAHTAADADRTALIGTYVLMRNALVKMISENTVPSQESLEAALFGS